MRGTTYFVASMAEIAVHDLIGDLIMCSIKLPSRCSVDVFPRVSIEDRHCCF